MSGKDKSIQDQLKQIFRISRGTGPPRQRTDYAISDEIQRQLSSDSPISKRLRALKELNEIVVAQKLEEKSVEKLWSWLRDLFESPQSQDVRTALFHFLQCLIKGQYERLGLLRAHFFRFIRYHNQTEDVVNRFDLLVALTENGKDILYFEEEVGPFLLNWFPEIERAGRTKDYLEMLITLIKYNAAYVDENVLSDLVKEMCTLCAHDRQAAIIMSCLCVLDTIVAYSNLPSESLENYVGTLCRTANIDKQSSTSWKVMRNLLGTHLGHSALFTMCRILQDPLLKRDTDLFKGAVCFIQMGLWSDQSVTTLRCPPSSVLPSILIAAKNKQPEVTFEIVMSMKQLIARCGSQLHDPEWEIISDILLTIIRQIDEAPNLDAHKTVVPHLNDTIMLIENLIELGKFYGEEEQFYKIIEECALSRPESSVVKLIDFLARDIIPIRHLWLGNLYNLLQKFYRQEVRTNIKVKALGVLSKVMKLNCPEYEDELVERIVVPHLVHAGNDSDPLVRREVVELLIELCMDCESKRCLEMLDILEKLLLRPFELYPPDAPVNEFEIADVKCAVLGLINLFMHKIHRLPSYHAIKIYTMLVTYLEQHYTKPKIFEDCNLIRTRILDCFLKMRADSCCHIGCPDSTGKLQFSPYLCVTYRGSERNLTSPPPVSPGANQQQQPFGTITNVPLRRVFKIFIVCLKQERDWEVLSLVLNGITQVLQNKSLILSKHGNNELDLLVNSLASMVIDKSLGLPETLRNSLRPSRSDFHAAVLMVMANLASYHTFLDPIHQQKIIRCLVKYGLVHKCSKQCIMALTICTLEMRDVMVKLLPEVLLDLSKISATVHIAVPVLEFLSTLTKLPTVYASFVGDQYMAVFAISLPYTNPFKYNHYIVSLAHHVIAVWFLKCRLPFRRDFITYITKGLQTNVLVPFEETNVLRTDLSKLNEDSSNRKRSSSLTEQSSRRRERASITTRPDFSRPVMDTTLLTFYEELTETCIDLMARYTFSSCSALPRRSSSTEYLLNNGHSVTWFLGNKLITVTTTGCSQKALKHGLCDKCWTTCRFESLKSSDTTAQTLKTNSSSEKDKEDTYSTHVTRQNSAENNTSASSPLDENKKLSDKLEDLPSKLYQYMSKDGSKNGEKQICVCWCQGWAEIYIRRATGDISWIIKMQNQLSHQLSMYDYPFSDLSTLFISSLHQKGDNTESSEARCHSEDTANPDEEISSTASIPISIPCSPNKQSPSRQSSRDSIEEDGEESLNEDGTKSRNPVRRSNSSPEMSASWKNPFLQKQEREDSRTLEEDGSKKNKSFTKDMRVSCEAIPEEISGMGTTPPSNEPSSTTTNTTTTATVAVTASQHPTLWSCHSYPGSAPPAEQTIVSKPSTTVPPSPNILQPAVPPLTLSLAQTVHTSNSSVRTSKSDSLESVGSDKSLERSSLSNLPPLTSKPPQSPTQTSPRLSRHIQTKEGFEIQKSSSLNLEHSSSFKLKDKRSDKEKLNQANMNQIQKRDRSCTISVMNTIRKPKLENLRRAISSRPRETPRSGISPSFVFLQLYHSAQFGNTYEKPLLVRTSPVIQRALKVLDCIPPYETHRIGVICVREGQCNNEVEILRNCFGSMRYTHFLQNLGSLIKLRDVDSQVVFLGGLEQDGNDGKFTYIWQDDVIRVTFHIATLMPNKESDPNCNNKKLHIGNNNVTIVYNESGEDYNINTIKGQFNFACIIVQPLDYNTNKVIVKAKDELIELMGNSEPKIVSDQNVAILARQLALHADVSFVLQDRFMLESGGNAQILKLLASLVSRSLKSQSQDPYASNWLERLRKIKNIQAKVLCESSTEHRGPEEASSKSKRPQMEDFSEYT